MGMSQAGSRMTLGALNATPDGEFARALDGVLEHAPWVAAGIAGRRPFASVAALHDALMNVLRGLPEPARLDFLNGHPELTAGALPDDMTDASRAEQGGAGLGSATGAADLPRLNAAYRARHGIPFIICLRRHTGADALRALRRRMENDVAAEREAALREVGYVSRLRLGARLDAADAGPPRGSLFLRSDEPLPDTALEAEGLRVGSWEAGDAPGTPLLSGDAFRIGDHALRIGGATRSFRIEDPERDLVLRARRDGAGEWGLYGM